MKRRPGTGTAVRQSTWVGSAAASNSRISAWSGSVSWNSSTNRCVKRAWNPRRTASLPLTRVAGLEQQVEEVERAGAGFQVLVAIDCPLQLLLQARREVGVGVEPEAIQMSAERLERLDDDRSRDTLARIQDHARDAPWRNCGRAIDRRAGLRASRIRNDRGRSARPGRGSPGSDVLPERCRETDSPSGRTVVRSSPRTHPAPIRAGRCRLPDRTAAASMAAEKSRHCDSSHAARRRRSIRTILSRPRLPRERHRVRTPQRPAQRVRRIGQLRLQPDRRTLPRRDARPAPRSAR